MPRAFSLLACLVFLCLFTSHTTFAAPPFEEQAAEAGGYRVMDLSSYDARSSMSTGVWSASKAAQDTFYIYGGPNSQEGRFETASGDPDAQGWTGVDLT